MFWNVGLNDTRLLNAVQSEQINTISTTTFDEKGINELRSDQAKTTF